MKAEKIILWCERVMVAFFCALIFFLPISIALVEVFSGLIFTLYFIKRPLAFRLTSKTMKNQSFLRKFGNFLIALKPVTNPLNAPLAAFIFVNLLSVLFSQHPMLSIKGFVGKLIQATFLYFSFLECMRTKERLQAFVSVFLLSAALIISNGWAQLTAGKEFIFGHVLEDRVSSTFRHANDFGSYLLIIGIVGLSLVLFMSLPEKNKKSSIPRQRLQLIFVLLGISIVSVAAVVLLGFTYSRGAWLGFFIGLLVLGIKDYRLLAVSAAVILIFYSVFSPKLVIERRVSLVYDNVIMENNKIVRPPPRQESPDVIPESGFATDLTGSGRQVYWQEAMAIIKNFPVLGAGINTYSVVGRDYKISWGGYPHNCYLQMAAEIGLIGLAVFLWFIWVLFRSSIAYIRKVKLDDRFLRAVLFGSLGATVGFLVHSAFDTTFYSVQLGNLIWIFFALVMTTQKVNEKF